MACSDILEDHLALAKRRDRSLSLLAKVRDQFGQEQFFNNLPVAVFCAGSLARLEVGENSDLDMFVTADEDDTLHSRLCEYKLFAHLIRLNEEMGFPAFSNDGEYLKIHFMKSLKDRTGSRRDDSENLFTVRMLLMLESQYLIDEPRYISHLNEILRHYYRDEKGKRSFRPLFLVNDLLRYWRTLCLNYEEHRHDPSRPWRKKNVNLKFSRMLTVFSTVLPLVAEPISTPDQLLEYCRKTPLERLAKALDRINNPSLTAEWLGILDIYEEFLTWKEDGNVEKYLCEGEQKERVANNAAQLSQFLHKALTDSSIEEEFRRYLVL